MGVFYLLASMFLENVRTCGGFYAICFILYFLNRILFLEKHTEKHRNRIKKMFVGYGIFTLAFFLFEFIVAFTFNYAVDNKDVPEIINAPFVKLIVDFFRTDYPYISSYLWYIDFFIPILILVYVCVTGRRRHKWLGIFSVVILYGYQRMLDAVICIPSYFLNDVSPLLSKLYEIIAYIALLIVFARINSEKHAPAFMKRIDDEAQERALSFKEEAGIWLIGMWLLNYSEFFPSLESVAKGESEFASIPVLIYLNVSNCVLGVVITAMIINGSYRRLYYKKNMRLQKSLITTMANLVESRDENTGGHIQRTAKYVEFIARELQRENKFTDILTDPYIEEMIIAAPLHDVGKIHIPDSVLNKPGKLDDEEFRTMKSHSAAGGRIIENVREEVGEVTYLKIAKEMAEYHHERMDGSGYPHGLTGTEIPLCARILAVADVFDALTSKRCYKDAFPLDKAFGIIKEETGTHFDKDVAEAFLRIRSEVEEYLDASAAEEAKALTLAESSS